MIVIENSNIIENLVTDFRNIGINITNNVINKISSDVDIQNSNIEKFIVNKWTQVKNKYVFIVNFDDTVVAIYNKTKFDYNPGNIKLSDVASDEYRCYELINNRGSIRGKQADRRSSRDGYIDTKYDDVSGLSNIPSSQRYVYRRDFDPQENKKYYSLLLQQNRLSQYESILNNGYDIVTDLIMHRRKEQTIGKRTVYNDWIQKLTKQIQKIELLLDGIHKNVDPDIDKVKKELKSLDRIRNDAIRLIQTEDDTIKRFGRTPARPPVKATRR